jgi:putative endopeptidase
MRVLKGWTMRFLQISAIICLCAVFALAQPSPSRSVDPPTGLPKLEHFDISVVDSAVVPCDDFYKYACGKWLGAHPIPADQAAWGPGGPLQLWNETVLLRTLEKASASDAKRTPNEQKTGDFYYACMDTKSIEARTQAWLKPELERIAGLKDKKQIAREVAHLHQTIPGAQNPGDDQTNAVLFGFAGLVDYDDASLNVAQLDQGGMGLPGRAYYLDNDAKSQEIRKKYVQHIRNILVLAGEKPDRAEPDAANVLAIETELAQGAMDPVVRRDPKNLNNKMSLEQVKTLTPSFDWGTYLKLVGALPSPHYLVTSPAFFQNLETMLQKHPLEHWKAYLRWQMLSGSSNTLNQGFVNETFDFYVRTLVGSKQIQPRWRRCVRSVDGNLGEALGQVYVAQAFPPESKQRVLKLVEDIEAAMDKDIQSLDWMTPETKKQAEIKLHATLNKIGYPDQWKDYSRVQIGRDSYLTNRQHAAAFEFQRSMAKIGKPADRMEWTMTPPTINAYEDPPTNTINFPAGMLQPPYFDPKADDAVNYGAVGMVIGHETIHGFDDQGRKFDARGNLRDWWTPQDGKEYEARGKCISDQYTQDVPEAGVKQNGLMTQGEDTADNGGARIAFMALEQALARAGKDLDTKEGDGITPRQRFFLSFAYSWCTDYRPELLRLVVLTDPHSYPRYRVNNTLSNMPEFWQAYGCQKGQRMVHDNACRVW